MKYTKYIMVLAIAALAVGVFWVSYSMSEEAPMKGTNVTMATTDMGYQKATFAGGCFWCMEPPFEKLDGVISVTSGYTGGHKKNPTYEEVSAGGTGHAESVEVLYDPRKVSYAELLETFWRSMDPTSSDRQFVDVGNQYRPAIFYHNEEQHKLALESKKALEDSGIFDDKPIVVEIVPAGVFYPAEEYHQDYYKKNPIRYHFYRFNSGRDRFLDKYWKGHDKPFFATPERLAKLKGTMMKDTTMKDTMPNESGKWSTFTKPSDEVLKKTLTPIQYKVTQKDGTEPAFNNEYWDNKREGIYVDVVSGEPLFSSKDKYKSGTGWPSFSKPLVPENIVLREDRGFFSVRTEVRSKHGDSHLGHVFDDGPPPTGKRYCMNSAALRFIPKEDLEKDGYGEFLKLFK